jgi:hypothetical protein
VAASELGIGLTVAMSEMITSAATGKPEMKTVRASRELATSWTPCAVYLVSGRKRHINNHWYRRPVLKKWKKS